MAPPARTGAAVVVSVAEQAAVVEQDGEEQPAAAALLPVGMVLVQVFTAVTLLLSELTLGAGGTRPLVLLVYRNLVGAAAVAPLAFLFERGMMKKMHAVVCGWISINATLGILLATGMYYYGLRDTNAAYSANFLNLIPIVTFIIAVILRHLLQTPWSLCSVGLVGATFAYALTYIVKSNHGMSSLCQCEAM